jgi:hypothetical protein
MSDFLDYTYYTVFAVPIILWRIVAAWSKACTLLARSDAGIVGSHPTQGMYV